MLVQLLCRKHLHIHQRHSKHTQTCDVGFFEFAESSVGGFNVYHLPIRAMTHSYLSRDALFISVNKADTHDACNNMTRLSAF